MVLFHLSDKNTARQLAEYLRGQGIRSARIKYIVLPKDGTKTWGTVVYVPSKDDSPKYLAALKSVLPPSFAEPEFTANMRILETDSLLPALDR